jgi:hypothetical protein
MYRVHIYRDSYIPIYSPQSAEFYALLGPYKDHGGIILPTMIVDQRRCGSSPVASLHKAGADFGMPAEDGDSARTKDSARFMNGKKVKPECYALRIRA